MPYYQLETIPLEQPKIPLPALGTWFMVSAKAVKVHESEDICTQWKRQQIEQRKMMFIGTRKVREGRMKELYGEVWDDDGCPMTVHLSNAFQSTRFIDMWLFVSSPYSKTTFVLPSDASEIPF